MGKGDHTRASILVHATELATRIGLGGLSIGGLATETGMSKSGLFAHFGSKEAMQVQALEAEADRFIEHVVRPALRADAGEPRVRALFDRWLTWANGSGKKGCLFVQSSAEFDDQPGAVRDALEQQQERWFSFLAEAGRRASVEGHFQSDLDAEQFAFELHALLLGFHHAQRMMRDPRAEERLRRAFERLLSSRGSSDLASTGKSQ
jgi:AcrR family transcriptional regulator